jgi:hypothetical protein
MRDEAVQRAGGLGALIHHAALIEFINRNYAADPQGRWFFQNGPQRVYVELAYAPWVVRLGREEPAAVLALTDHTGGRFEPSACWVDEDGSVLFVDTGMPLRVALLHDHDLDLFAEHAQLPEAGAPGAVYWRADQALPLGTLAANEVPSRFGFVRSPAAAGLG